MTRTRSPMRSGWRWRDQPTRKWRRRTRETLGEAGDKELGLKKARVSGARSRTLVLAVPRRRREEWEKVGAGSRVGADGRGQTSHVERGQRGCGRALVRKGRERGSERAGCCAGLTGAGLTRPDWEAKAQLVLLLWCASSLLFPSGRKNKRKAQGRRRGV